MSHFKIISAWYVETIIALLGVLLPSVLAKKYTSCTTTSALAQKLICLVCNLTELCIFQLISVPHYGRMLVSFLLSAPH